MVKKFTADGFDPIHRRPPSSARADKLKAQKIQAGGAMGWAESVQHT
jgi:hypothetical protein